MFDPNDITALLAFHRATFGDARMEEGEGGEPPEGAEGTDGGDEPKDEPWDEERAKAAFAKKNSENQSLRKRLKDAEPLLAELQSFKDKDKSEADKLADREKTLSAREAAVLRGEIALEKGLTAGQAKRLVGSTREELEADAAELLADLGGTPEPKKAPPAAKAKERLRGGGDPTEEPEEMDPAKLAARIPRRF